MTDPVREFEKALAEYCGAEHAIALANGTCTLHTALVALGVKPGDRVAVPPLTMSATTIAVLHAGARPIFRDVDADTWLMKSRGPGDWLMPVSLYGLHYGGSADIEDAAQTLRRHDPAFAFTSLSFQASKILALGEGGALLTDSEELAERARSFSSLGYKMAANQPRIDKRVLKDPAYERHHTLGWNYRMAPAVAGRALKWWGLAEVPGGIDTQAYWHTLVQVRRDRARLYRDAVSGCSWIKPQHVPEGWTHDYWSFAVALESADLWHPLADAIERHGGTRPFAAWRLTYQEPAFRHLAEDGSCPVAEDLQPRIVAFQTNDLASAQKNADAVNAAIYELNGVPA